MSDLVDVLPEYDCWHIPDNIDRDSFDFTWRPDPREPAYIYEFGTQWQKTGGPRYIVENATEIKYVDIQKSKALPNLKNWNIPDTIDKNSFDFSWHPDNTEQAFIYQFGTQHQKTGGPSYIVEDATQTKYVDIIIATILPNKEHWTIPNNIDVSDFDFSWHPDDTEQPYIYEFATIWNERGGPVYTVPGASEKKYIVDVKAKTKSNKDNWDIPYYIDIESFDFSWVPHPESPPYIYEFGTQHQKTGGPKYIVEDATDIKYVDVQRAKRLPNKKLFEVVDGIAIEDFDYSWHPDNTDDPFIYIFGNTQYPAEIMPTVKYTVEGATQIKYVKHITAKLKQTKKNWVIPKNIDTTTFDFSWVPNPKDPPYIYQFGTQWQETGGPKYVVPGATEIKYVDNIIGHLLPERDNWEILIPIIENEFDFTWHPHPEDPPYIYVFGNSQYKAEEMQTVRYVVPGATAYKYMTTPVAKLAADMTFWQVPENVDAKGFDFSWKPNPADPPYIYVFGTQHQKTGGPRYVVPLASEYKYVDTQKVEILPNMDNWHIPDHIDDDEFDFSWHPDDTDPPYIYQFGTQWQETGGPRYVVPGATEIKYVKQLKTKTIKGRAKVSRKHWIIPKNIDDINFDYSWHPDEKDGPYIYVFGTQHQKTGGPRYVVPGATELKFVSFQKVVALPDKNKWIIPDNLDVSKFDFSWHPDETEPAYRYEFNTQWQSNGGPIYVVKGATETKYLHTNTVFALPTTQHWEIPPYIKVKSFDYSWHPDNTDTPYIYAFGNNLYPAENMATVKYVMPGATQIKFVDNPVATLDTNYNNWIIPEYIDRSSFDFSWVPDPTHPPYIYEFATIWNDRGGPIYKVPGSFAKKYIEDVKAKTLPNKKHWKINIPIVEDENIFTWVPHPEAPPYIYVFGNQWNTPENESTLEYHVPGATKNKYVHDVIPKVKPNKQNFVLQNPIDEASFDFSWRPNPYDPPYIYEFGTQHQKTGGPKYIVEGATEKKYVNTHKAKALATTGKHWVVLKEVSDFDFSWHPDNTDEPYIYVFGNQWHDAIKMPTIEYHVEGATERKYITDIKATLKPNYKKFKQHIKIANDGFDFSWVPDPNDPPYIYVFGNQWNDATIEPTLEYHVEGATEYKYITDIIATVLPDDTNFKTLIPVENFDYSWRPNPKDPPYIYVWGNQWHSAEKEATIEYHTPGATDRKYINDTIGMVAEDTTYWEIPKNINVDMFDFSWRPDPGSPPYTYQFGTLADDNDGPRYIHPDSTGEIVRLLRVERKTKRLSELTRASSLLDKELPKYYITTTLDALVKQHPSEVFWALNKNINYNNFDFNWRPSIEQARYVHVFGSPESEATQTYFVSAKMYLQGHRDFNFVEKDIKVNNEYLATLFKPSDVFFIDRGNVESNERYEKLKERFPNIIKTRYLNNWADTIARCIKRCNTQLAWILNSELDYTNFNLKYYPNPWQMKMIHVFGTQWSHWGTTYLINCETFLDDTKFIKIIEHLNNLNFVKGNIAKATNCLYDVYLIDHGNDIDSTKLQLENSTKKSVNVIAYKESYLKTFKNLLQNLETKKEHYIWVCSSVCDYTGFDFSYICDPFAKENLHVFPSNNQKFGDTFLIDVNRLRTLIDELKILEDYQKVNYNQHQKVRRLNPPVFVVNEDTHFNSCDKEYDFPYALFYTKDNENLNVNYKEPMSLWATHTKNIEMLSTGGSVLVMPKQVKEYIHDQLYDYPYITKAKNLVNSNPLDIVYLSNGEKAADQNYEYLLKITKGLPNRVIRVDGVQGRVAAYHAAAEASNTPWMFTIFAKLKVDKNFDFNWQPDRLQIPKHYIFNAKNPLNDLVYGHQAIIAYNKKLALKNSGKGLDFTLDDPHESVDMLSGIANFNTDAYSTWRTAFREVIKLKSDTSDISYERLQIWLNKAEGNFAEDCLRGANDAVEYYSQVAGDITKLKYSYEWSWLQDYYNRKYK